MPEQLRGRLAGDSIASLRADAKKLAVELGYAEAQPRAAGGRYARFSDQIRAAAGRAPAVEPEPPTGDVGIGRGAGAVDRPRPRADMNSLIRATREARRGHVLDLAEMMAVEEASR